MKKAIDYVRINEKGKDVLVRCKKRFGLEHWNELTRMALMLSLADSEPPNLHIGLSKGGGIDIEWKTFAGAFNNELTSLLIVRGTNEGLDMSIKEVINEYFKLHMERGLVMLGKNTDYEGVFL